jgi:hypothetical protein
MMAIVPRRFEEGAAYSLRRATIDVTERFGLQHGLLKEPDFDPTPFDRSSS